MIIIQYIVKKIFKKQLFILSILFLVLFCQKLVQILNFSVNENISIFFVVYLVFLSLLEISKLILLLSLFLGILITLKNLYVEREVIAMYSCGLGKYILYCSVFVVCFVNTIFVTIDVFWISPWSLYHRNKLLFNIKYGSNIFGIFSNRFYLLNNGNCVLFVHDIKNNQFHDIFIIGFKPLTKEVLYLLVADSGYVESSSTTGVFSLVLNQGVCYEGFRKNVSSYFSHDFFVMNFNKYQVLLCRDMPNIFRVGVEQMNFFELFKLSTLEASIEFHWRLVLISSIWIMSVFSVILSVNYFRQNYFFSVLSGIIFYLFFFCCKLFYVFIILRKRLIV